MFEFTGEAKVEGVEIRNGQSEAKVSIIVKLNVENVSSKAAAAALGVDSEKEVENAFFRSKAEDADRNARFLNLKAIQCKQAFEGKHVLAIQGLRKVRIHKLSKIALDPIQHCKFGYSFVVSIEQPHAGYIESLAQMLHQSVRIELEQVQTELALEQAA